MNPLAVTDAQLAILVSAILGFAGTIAGALKWAVGRITKALDDANVARDKQTDAQLELAKALTAMTIKLDQTRNDVSFVRDWVEDHTPMNGIEQPPEMRPTTPTRSRPEIKPYPRPRTNPGGVPIIDRPFRRGRDDD